MTITQDLKATRLRLALSQAEAARLIGVSVQAIRAWEQGWRSPAGLYRAALHRWLRKHRPKTQTECDP